MKTSALPLLHPLLALALALASAACDVGPEEGPQQRSDQEVRGDYSSADAVADRAANQDRVCWTDRDCGDGENCRGARICPPGALCGPLADQPGTCTSSDPSCELDGRRYRPGESFGPCNACECSSDGSVLCRDFVCLECRSDAECPEGYACERPSYCPPGALCRPIADPAGYCMPADPSSTAACTPEECGPAPLMPNRLCDDGVHYSGPSGRCLRGDDGSCSHEILSCPNCGSATCSGEELCLRQVGGAPEVDGDGEVQHRCVNASRYMVCDGFSADTDALPSAHLSCGCLDLGSLCGATVTCEDDTQPVRVTCTAL